MSNKNPFEIRSDILALAKDYMDKQHAANVEMTERLIQLGQKSVNESIDAVTNAYAMYTPEELLKQAEKMYQQFVCKGDK